MYRLFSSKDYVPDGVPYLPFLWPFWGPGSEDPHDPSTGRFDEWVRTGHQHFEITEDLGSARGAVLPISWEHALADDEAMSAAERFSNIVSAAGKPIVVFFWSDDIIPVELEGSVVFRTSLIRSARADNEWAMPAWSEDFLERHYGGEVVLRTKSERPRVAFCGFADDPYVRSVRRYVRGGLRKPKGLPTDGRWLRFKSLRILASDRRIDENFIVRNAFHGGMLEPGLDTEERWRIRREYVENIIESDYVLCVRGGGNFSYRFYETLSCGRIPVFIDSDCVLPREDSIDWNELCVIVPYDDLSSLPERVLSFHESLDPGAFRDHQARCREIWERKLSPQGFYPSIIEYLGRAE